MAKSILVTINSPVSPSFGPIFNISTDVGIAAPSVATLAQLLLGYTISVDVSATQIIIVPAFGDCKTPLTLEIMTTTTTTTK